jgi:hypothetical protein
MWNYVYAFTNASIFVLLPLAYFYHEAEEFNTRDKITKEKFKHVFLNWLVLLYEIPFNQRGERGKRAREGEGQKW